MKAGSAIIRVCQKGGRTETDRTYPVSLTIITTITVVVVVMIYKQHECIDEERLYGLGLPLYGSAKKGDGRILVQKGKQGLQSCTHDLS